MSANRNTVSAFRQFVYERTTGRFLPDPKSSEQSGRLDLGVRTEPSFSKVAASLGLPSRGWECIHRGIAGDKEKKVYESRWLSVDGERLKCCPDLVYRLSRANKDPAYVIVEQKLRTSRHRYPAVPDGCWPNVRAQLWCYAWIDEWDWIGSNDVIMMAEYFWCSDYSIDPVYLGLRGVWRRSDAAFNKECSDYFLQYGGKVDPRLLNHIEL